MKYKASNTTLWKNDSGKLIQLIANVTVIESRRKLDNGSFPYFYKVTEEVKEPQKPEQPKNAEMPKAKEQPKIEAKPKQVARPRPVVKLPQKK